MSGKSIYDSFIIEDGKTYISKKDLDLLIIEGTMYRHFKGNMYMLERIAFKHDTDLSDLNKICVDDIIIVYTALYGLNLCYTRPLMDFIAELPDRPDNKTGQKRRFEIHLISEN